MKTINPQTQSQQTASTRNMKKNIPKTIVIKQWKTSDEEKNLKSNQGNKRQVGKKGTKIRMAADFLLETM